MRGRPKKAISILNREIDGLGFKEDYLLVRGMIIMAYLLGKITDVEMRDFEQKLKDKRDETVF